MSLNPVIYEDNVTVIHAANLNSIQDAILANESAIAGKVSASDYSPTTKTSAMTQAVGKDGNGKLWTEPGGGAGLIIKGYYPTLQSLIANVPHPALGDTYGVGSAAPYEIYMWDGSVWVDNGTIKGEKGDPGEDGEDGFAPAVTITPITGGHRVNITDATHPSGQDFDVMDGAGNVDSVNGQTGTVVLDGADINVDDTAATPQTIKAKIASIDNINTQQSSDIVAIRGNISNRNLLDNAWFGSGEVVNQRGVTTFTGNWNTYCIDRWKYSYGSNTSSSGTVQSNGILMTGDLWFFQLLETSTINSLNGKVATFSILYSDGTIESVTTTIKSTFDVIDMSRVELFINNSQIQIRIKQNITIRAMKLEVGSISTLAMDTAPNYAEELLKCQRYYYKVDDGIYTTCVCAGGFTVFDTIYFPTTMNSPPSISVAQAKIYYAGWNIVTIDTADLQRTKYGFQITSNAISGMETYTSYRAYILDITATADL